MVQLQLHADVCTISQLNAGIKYIETKGSEREELLLYEERRRNRDGEFRECGNRENSAGEFSHENRRLKTIQKAKEDSIEK